MGFQLILKSTLIFFAVVFSGNVWAGDPSMECVDQLKSKDELQILMGKVALGSVDDQTLEILANDDVPTKKEKEVIPLWAKARQTCKKLGAEWRNNNYPPTLIPIVDGYYSDFTSLAADLYAKKISYGEFAKTRARLEQEFMKNMAIEAQLIRQQEQAEKLQREALDQKPLPASDLRTLDAATIRQRR